MMRRDGIPPHEDKRLVDRLLNGEEAAFDAFFERYFPGLYRFALARLHKDADAAEEVAQAALGKAVQKLASYRGEAALFTWLCTFCRHEIASHYERQPRASQRVELLEDSREIREALELLGRGDMDPEQLLGRKEISHLVQVTLDHLPGRYGDALEWKYVEGLSVAAIAERLGLRPKAAESLLTRARVAFREGWTAVCESATAGLDKDLVS